MKETQPILCVDLDGTLVCGDLLIESALALVKRNPLYVLLFPFWLLGGRAFLKHAIASRVELDVALLPLNQEVVRFLTHQRAAGRSLILATASHTKYAEQLAAHLGLFDRVIASDRQTNLNGRRKLARLEQACGATGFDYMGNAHVDLPIWRAAQHAYIVDAPARVRRHAYRTANVQGDFRVSNNRFTAFIKAARPHQWLKNLLVFVPMIAGHRVDDPVVLFSSMLAFIAFSLAASSGYLLNDLLDLEADRLHPNKRKRPLASGALPITWGAAGVPLLLLSALTAGYFLSWLFVAVLLIYYGLTMAYSLWLKRVVMLDVTVLAMLYTMRILAGSIATGISLSFWLLAFSLFVFLSLAILKRYSELLLMVAESKGDLKGRGYHVNDLGLLGMLGTSSGLLSVLVLALYINSEGLQKFYAQPQMIWFLCPLLLYWIGRVWFKAHRGEMHDDPVVFAATDPVSLLIVALGAGIFLLAI